MDQQDFLEYLIIKGIETESIFRNFYNEKAEEEGDWMRDDDRFYGSEGSEGMENEEIYEDFAHTTGYSASYHGAYGVILEMGEGFDVDPEDEDLQIKVIEMMGEEY